MSKAETATEKRFESVNEFRQTLSDQTRSFVSKVEFDAGWVYLIGGISVAATLASLVALLVQRAS